MRPLLLRQVVGQTLYFLSSVRCYRAEFGTERTMASSKLSSASSWQGTVLSKDNLETYTDWLIELRDYVYSHGSLCGELMEHHLIGEPCEIPVVAGGPGSTDDDSQQ